MSFLGLFYIHLDCTKGFFRVFACLRTLKYGKIMEKNLEKRPKMMEKNLENLEIGKKNWQTP